MKGTVVIISIVHWHFTWQSQHNIARGLAERGYRVLFVEPLPKRWPRINEFGRLWGRLTADPEASGLCRQPLVPGVELVTPRLFPDTGPIFQELNRRFFVPRITDSLPASELEPPLIVINYLPTSASLALNRSLKPDVTIYHCVNDWVHDPYISTTCEAELAAEADMVWADSPLNVSRTSAMNDHVIQLAKGVDTALFARARKDPEPTERPLCAYFGTIRGNTDVDILRAVSHRYPLRLIGPVRRPLDGFAEGTEVIGAVEHDQVPELLRDADVLLLPYTQTAFNEGLMPAKLFECLATGKPAIVSGLASLGEYAHLFYICDDQESFLRAIERATREAADLRDERIACAERNSYAQRLEEIEGYIQQALERKQSGRALAGEYAHSALT